jgi:exodeoxyribonuclease VII large subunit
MSDLFSQLTDKILTVGELTREVKGLLEDAFPSVWVVGEVSKLTRHGSGHWYFALKDEEARLGAAMFRGHNLRVKFDLRDGMKVIARGRLSVYPPRGDYQLLVEELRPEGIGPLELAFRQLKEKLALKGYFEPGRKRGLPQFPRRIVLVTSPTGAVVRDMLEILGRRWPAVEVWICPVPVQGDGAAERIAAAIRTLNRLSGIDLMIVGRGGGSLEDLWAFNEECVAHAIFESRIPVVSGVGHETDFTIADMVADLRAETPSAAAMHVVPDRLEMLERLRGVEGRLRDLLRRRLERGRDRLDGVLQRRCFRLPLERIRDLERRLDDSADRLGRAAKLRLSGAQQRLELTAARLESLSPLNVLRRGYSLTRKEADQSVVRRAEQVRPGDRIVTLLQSGRLLSRVEDVPDASPECQG